MAGAIRRVVGLSGTPWTGGALNAIALRTRCNAGGIGEHGLASARDRLIDAPPPLAATKHLAREFPADPSIGTIGWRAEHARPAMITRSMRSF